MRKARNPLVAAIIIGLLAGPPAGVLAQDAAPEVSPPVEFTARWTFGPNIREATRERLDGMTEGRGGAWQARVLDAATDQRLDGTVTIAANMDDFAVIGLGEVGHYAFRIENDEGVWQQLPTVDIIFPGGENPGSVGVLIGEGEYDGLIAVFHNDLRGSIWNLRGYIIEGEVPPAPEPVISG